MGVQYWEDGDEYEHLNWYMKLSKCNNETSEVTCKPTEEINEYIENIIMERYLN